jgi:hypothetical protein
VNPDDMINKLSGRLSLRRRVATVTALLGGLIMATVIGLLWATEPALPPRTQIAFGMIVGIGLAWAVYGVWALARRTPLFALDRVVAGWLALTATALLTAFTSLLTILLDRGSAVWLALTVALLVLAAVNLHRARTYRAALLRRKQQLDRRT